MALADRLVPAHVALFDRSVGMGRARVIGTLAELGVADELAGSPATAEELAGRLNVNADALHRVMRAAALEGILKLDRRGVFCSAARERRCAATTRSRCATGRATFRSSPRPRRGRT